MNKKLILKTKECKDQGLSRKETSEILNKSFHSIKHLYSRLSHNTEANIEKIKKLINEYSCVEIDKLINTPKGTVNTLCLLNDITVKKTKSLSYSEYEIKIMKEYYPQMGKKFVANLLNVSEMRIRTMAAELNLKRDYQYSQELEKKITNDFKNGMKPFEIGEKYGRTTHAIESFLSRRHLVNGTNPNSPYYISQPEKYMIKYITEKLNVNVPDKENSENRNYYYKIVKNYEVDLPLYINGYKFAIEYDGEKWHQDKEKDAIKTKDLQDAGYIVFRISSNDHNNNFYNLKTLNKKLDEIVNAIQLITGSL